MTQRTGGGEEDYGSCKTLSKRENRLTVFFLEAMANTCASSRGNT